MCINVKAIVLYKRTQTEKALECLIPFIGHSRKSKAKGICYPQLPGVRGTRKEELTKMALENFSIDKYVLYLNCGRS